MYTSPSDQDDSDDDASEYNGGEYNSWETDEDSFDDGPYGDILGEMDLSECIRYWALKTNQTHESINLIMEIIRRKTNVKRLPRSARTLLKTSRQATSNIVEKAGGQFWFQGIRKCLIDFFR